MKKKPLLILLFLVALLFLILALVFLLPREVTLLSFGGEMEYNLGDHRLSASPGAVLRAQDGSFYVADSALHVIWQVKEDSAQIVAGALAEPDFSGVVAGSYRDGEALQARFDTPTALLKYQNGFLISDSGNHVLRYFDVQEKTVITFAGDGSDGNRDGFLEEASFSAPMGMCLDEAGNIYVADNLNHSIRKIDPAGYVSTFLGGESGFADGSFDVARLSKPSDIVCHKDTFYIADTGNAAIRAVEAGELVTLCGGEATRAVDGTLSGAALVSPTDLVLVGESLYFTDTGASAVRLLENGRVKTLIRAGEQNLLPLSPRGIWVEQDAVYVADSANDTLEVFER